MPTHLHNTTMDINAVNQNPDSEPRQANSAIASVLPGFNLEGIQNSREIQPNLFGYTANYTTKEHLYSSNPSPYADSLLEHLEYKSPGEFLKDQVLIDLGAGRESYGYRIAAQFGARAYVANELEFGSYKRLVDELSSAAKVNGNKLPIFAFAEDMMATLNRIPAHCASFLISGLDEFILHDRGYAASLADKIIEKVAPGGVVALASSHESIVDRINSEPSLEEIMSLKPEFKCLRFSFYRKASEEQFMLANSRLTPLE